MKKYQILKIFTQLWLIITLPMLLDAALFRRPRFKGSNVCQMDMQNYAATTWSSMEKLTSNSITKEMKICSFYCLQDPKCLSYQIVRLKSGSGFCYIFHANSIMNFVEESICQNFMRTSSLLF